VKSARGERAIDAKSFFTGALTTALRDDEMLVEIEVPSMPLRTGTCFLEIARRRGDYAMMGVAAVLTHNEARLAFCNAGGTPVLVKLDRHQFDDVAAQVQAQIDPPGNVHATKEYQRHLAGVLARRALQAALERAQ
jgi:aerobic carbon-monoxide dehydrogenase medium subunit